MPSLLLLTLLWWTAPILAEGFICAGRQGAPTQATPPADVAAKPARITQSGTTGTRRALVLFACFKGENTTIPSWAADLFNPDLPGSFSHFYDTMSFGKLQVRGEVAPRVYESSQPASAYLSADPSELGQFGQFSQEILRQADRDLDFSRFDNDGPDGIPNSRDDDGVADAVFIVMERIPAGFLLSEATGISQLGFEQALATRDLNPEGKPVQVWPGRGTIEQGRFFAEAVGAMCHEYGHVLGLPDLYDTEFFRKAGTGPEEDGAGVGAWCLMGWGTSGWNGDDGPNSFCAWSRLQLGWAQAEQILQAQQQLRLRAVSAEGQIAQVPLTNREFFLLEYRTREGYYDRHLPGEGVLIWHLERQLTQREQFFGEQLEASEVFSQFAVDLECADGRWRDAGYPEGTKPDSERGEDNLDFWAHDVAYARQHHGNLGDATDPFDGVRFTSFTPQTNPAAYSADRQRSVRIEGIHLADGQALAQVQTEPLLIALDRLKPHPLVAGQEEEIQFRLRNQGGVSATALKVVLSCQDSLVEILEPEARFEDLGVEQSSIAGALGGVYPRLRFKDQFAGTHQAELSLDIYANGGLVEQAPFSLVAVSARQHLLQVSVIDTSGNKDGEAQRGEFIRLGLKPQVDAPELLSLLRFGLYPLDKRVLPTSTAEVTFDRNSGETNRSPEFLLSSALEPGTLLAFSLRVKSETSAWLDTLFVEVGRGEDQTSPRVGLPQVAYQGADLAMALPTYLVIESGPLRAASVQVYSAKDTAEIAAVPLSLDQGQFTGVWSQPAPGNYLVRATAEDLAGNRGQSAFKKVYVYPPEDQLQFDGVAVSLGKGSVNQVAYSPDGQWLATAGSAGIWLYEATTLRVVELSEGHEEWLRALAFSPDSRLLASAGGRDAEVRLWDLAQRRASAVLEVNLGQVSGLAFSPDGRWLALVGGGNTVRVWDVVQQLQTAILSGTTTGGINGVAFSPNGRLLAAAASDKTVRLWRVGDWQPAGILAGHKGRYVLAVAFSPDSQVLAAVDGYPENSVRLWNVAQQEEIGVLENTGTVIEVAFSPDGRVLATCGSRGVQLWDADRQYVRVSFDEEHYTPAFAFSPEGQVLAAVDAAPSPEVRLWDLATQREGSTITGYTNAVSSVAFSPDGRILAAGYQDATLRLWDPARRAARGLLSGHVIGKNHFPGVNALSFSPDGRLLASGGGDGTLRLWEVEQQHQVEAKEGSSEIRAAVFSPDGHWLVWAQEGRVYLQNTASQQEIERLTLPGRGIETLAFSPDSRLLAMGGYGTTVAGGYGTIALWDMNTHKEIAAFEGELSVGQQLAFSPDGRLLAMGISYPDTEVRLWDVVRGLEAGVLVEKGTNIYGVAFSPDSRLLACSVSEAGKSEVHVWDVVQQKLAKELRGHTTQRVSALAFSPDGEILATGGEDGTVRLWDLGVATAVEDMDTALPQRFSLSPNYPNPFNPSTTIRFSLPQAGEAELSIYNLLGQRVATLVRGMQEAGAHVLQWDGRNEQGRELASGVYFCRLQAGAQVETRKLLLLR